MFNKIIITGAAGFVGSHVYDHFSGIYPKAEIIILDKMTYAADIILLLANGEFPCSE